jgi:guanylate kinase
MIRGKIIVISGPSGVGKTTLYKRLLAEFNEPLSFSVSATTRKPRPYEKDGLDYYFISREDFQSKIESGEFIEWAEVYHNFYGTLKTEINRIIHDGKNCLLDLDVQGGMNIKKNYPDSSLIFIAPPSLDELKKRISARNEDKPEVILVRMEDALHELSFKDHYDHIIVNDNLEHAYLELKETVLETIEL